MKFLGVILREDLITLQYTDFKIFDRNDGSFNTSYFSIPTSSTKGILNIVEIDSDNHYGQNPVEYNDT